MNKKRIVHLTNILKTNSARCVVKVYTADFQGVQLRNVMPADLHIVQNHLHPTHVWWVEGLAWS